MAYAKGTGGNWQASTLSYQSMFYTVTISKSYYQHFFISKGDFPLFFIYFSLGHIVQFVFLFLAFLQNNKDIRLTKFLQHWVRRTQATDILHEHSVDSRRQLCSPLLQCNNKSDFTLVSYSLTAVSSLRLPMVFPFEADLISHIRTSIFLKRAE